MNIILCGMMSSGKTTVGKALAARLSREWVDTDSEIERVHGKITEIFEKHGEAYFRALEEGVADTLSRKDELVVSTGGGFFMSGRNAKLLKKNGKIIFLRAEMKTLKARLEGDNTRPLLQGKEPLGHKLNSLIKFRYPIYESVSDYALDVDEKTVDEIVDEIMSTL